MTAKKLPEEKLVQRTVHLPPKLDALISQDAYEQNRTFSAQVVYKLEQLHGRKKR